MTWRTWVAARLHRLAYWIEGVKVAKLPFMIKTAEWVPDGMAVLIDPRGKYLGRMVGIDPAKKVVDDMADGMEMALRDAEGKE